MEKNEYINRIKYELGFLDENERYKAVEYFESYFIGAENTDDVISCLGDANTAAKNYCKNLSSSEKQKKPFVLPAWTKTVIMIIIAPTVLTVGLGVAFAAAALTFIAVLLLIGIAGCCIAMWLGGVKMIIDTIGMNIILADKLLQLGMGFLFFAVGTVLTGLVLKWYIKMFPWILKIIVNNGEKLLRRKSK